MTDYERFQDLFDHADATTKREGKYFSQLEAEDKATLEEFVIWLRDNGIKVNTSNSYKTYMAKALALPGEPLTSDQRSAVKKFKEFLQDRA